MPTHGVRALPLTALAVVTAALLTACAAAAPALRP
jgi:hypothetical protein